MIYVKVHGEKEVSRAHGDPKEIQVLKEIEVLKEVLVITSKLLQLLVDGDRQLHVSILSCNQQFKLINNYSIIQQY